MTNNLRTFVAAGALVLVAAGALAVWPRAASADKAPGCQQWEVMLSPSSLPVINANALPELGKPIVEKSPAGWEPFAFTPSGQLVYRRCAK